MLEHIVEEYKETLDKFEKKHPRAYQYIKYYVDSYATTGLTYFKQRAEEVLYRETILFNTDVYDCYTHILNAIEQVYILKNNKNK